jgi:hypothetical protein
MTANHILRGINMPTFTVTYSDSQEGTTTSSVAGIQGAPPPFVEVAAASDQQPAALDLQGAGPPPIPDLAAAVGARGFDEFKGAGPPPVPGLAAAIATGSAREDDLGEAGPPPVTPVFDGPSDADLNLGAAGPPPEPLS